MAKRSTKRQPTRRPNIFRQLGLAAIAATVMIGGYYGGYYLKGKDAVPVVAPKVNAVPDGPTDPLYEEGMTAELHLPEDLPTLNVNVHEAGDEVASLPPSDQVLWEQNANPMSDVGDIAGKKLIAIVIDDMGVDRRRSAQMIDMDAALTLSFLTYAKNVGEQTELAKFRGHELMVHMAMEPTSTSVDPGPNVLLTSQTDAEIRSRLEWGLSRFDGYIGINNHMGSKFTSDARGMGIVIDEVKKRGVLFLDSRTAGSTVGTKTAVSAGLPRLERNVFLDHVSEVPAVFKQLQQVENLAAKYGAVIAIGHPRDATIEALSSWIPTLAEKGFTLVPLSTIARLRK